MVKTFEEGYDLNVVIYIIIPPYPPITGSHHLSDAFIVSVDFIAVIISVLISNLKSV